MTQELAGVDFTSTTCALPRKADPGAPVVGEIWVNAGLLKYRDNAGSPATHVLEITDNRNVASGYAGLTAGGQVAIAQGGTNSGTALAGSSIMVSNGTAIVQGAAGTATTVLHGNAAGAPTYSAVALGADVSGTLPIGNGGTGQGTAAAAFNALSPTTLLGDLIYGSGAATNARLAGNTTATRQFLSQTGTGTVSAAPAWGTLLAADIPNLDASKITTGTLAIARGGTNLGAYAVGDLLYASAVNVLSALAANATTTKKYLSMTSSVPSWDTGPAVFTGASSSVAGTTGIVPQPLAGNQDSILFGSSTWRLLLATDIPDTLQFDSVAAPAVPVEGNFWNDSTQKCLTSFVDGVKQYDVRALFVQTADNLISNTATETSLYGTGIGTMTLPANFWAAGKSLRLRLRGLIQYSGSGSGATIRVKFGSTVLAVSAALVFTGAAASPGTYFEVDLLVTCRTTGATGTLMASGTFFNQTYGFTAGMISSAAVVVNTTTSQTIDATYQWTSASATRIVKTTNATTEVIG